MTVLKHVLIVTDNDDFFELYATVLAADAWKVTRLESANDINGTPMSAALLDVVSDADWDRVRTVAVTGIPSIVVTGWWAPDRRYRERVSAAGAAAYILKPASPLVVAAIVERVAAGATGIDVVPRELEPGRDRRQRPRD